jgi:hypothetical protein
LLVGRFGAQVQHEVDGLVGRPNLQPALLSVGGVLDELEAHRLGPERLGPLLIFDLDDHLAHPTDHAELLSRRQVPSWTQSIPDLAILECIGRRVLPYPDGIESCPNVSSKGWPDR